ncbi:MAG: hypothetical protein A2283_24250 [Lentisphaerae bacterium RIFOXYA12_FULL_48_11]|nr:MAG: hypothetical protein A2283_24250 [Lentisphaerae bacterium RIFOXYA12_FULL_48_11]
MTTSNAEKAAEMDGENIASVSSGVTSEGINIVTGNDQSYRLIALVDELGRSKTVPTSGELEKCGAALKQAVLVCEVLQSKTDKTTVEIYYDGGCLIRGVKRRLKNKKAFDAWLRNQATHPGQMEVFRQMCKIESMGPDILRYSFLGKNRVLHLFYMFKGMEELSDGVVNADSVRRRLKELETLYPFPAHAAMTDHEVNECKLHMDAIITLYRLVSAFGIEGICTFDDAKLIARHKKNALERGAAKSLAEKMADEVDKVSAVKDWIANGMKLQRNTESDVDAATDAGTETTPERIAEVLARASETIGKIVLDPEIVARFKTNGVVVDAVDAAYASVMDLYNRLHAAVEAVNEQEVGF